MNKNDYTIRSEKPDDYRIVENIVREAFWNLNVPGCSEHYFAHILREHKDFIPELDFVLETEGKIIANIMYAKSELEDENGVKKPIVTFGPIAVHPDYQRKGFGKALIEHSFSKAVEMGYDVIVIFGNPDNYVARGFKSCLKYNICLEGDIYPTAMLVKELKSRSLDGRKWIFRESSAGQLLEDAEAVACFDTLFAPKEKKWQPSQEEFYIHSHSVIKL